MITRMADVAFPCRMRPTLVSSHLLHDRPSGTTWIFAQQQ